MTPEAGIIACHFPVSSWYQCIASQLAFFFAPVYCSMLHDSKGSSMLFVFTALVCHCISISMISRTNSPQQTHRGWRQPLLLCTAGLSLRWPTVHSMLFQWRPCRLQGCIAQFDLFLLSVHAVMQVLTVTKQGSSLRDVDSFCVWVVFLVCRNDGRESVIFVPRVWHCTPVFAVFMCPFVPGPCFRFLAFMVLAWKSTAFSDVC